MDFVNSLFGMNKPAPKPAPPQQRIVLSWKQRHYDIPLTHLPRYFHEVTVGDLKEISKKKTGIPVAGMRLIVSGAYMKDDTATLPSCGIQPGSIIIIEGERPNEDQIRQTASGNPEEYGLIIRINKVLDKIGLELIHEVDMFEAILASLEYFEDEHEQKKLNDQGIFLSEQLMQGLITLDGVDCPPQFDAARQRRREGVRISQELLDRVDRSRTAARLLCIKPSL
ncbi:hypothetical protein CLU79DRAFT_767898 [Phycomyces nitens]|nr:hypothetical protein CLU79DRAFT_767898 [Phycomyces nitens]